MAAKQLAAAVERPSTLHDHIRELRTRAFVIAIIFITATTVAYTYKDPLLRILMKPLGDQKLYYFNPAGAFQFIFQISIYIGIAVTIPFLVYNLYRFVAPALPPKAQRHSFLVLVSSLLLLVSGILFGYIYAIPGAINFLSNFGDGYVTAMLSGDSYLSFILAYTSGLGILFQLPLILLFIHWVHPLKPTKLLKFEKFMILIAFVLAAIVTPTSDIINLCIIAAPIIVMYQIGVIAVAISSYNTRKQDLKAMKRQGKAKASQQIAPASAVFVPLESIMTRSDDTPSRQPVTLSSLVIEQPPKVQSKPDLSSVSSVATPANPIVRRTASLDGFKPRVHMDTKMTRTMPVKHEAPVRVPERRYTLQPMRRAASIDGISIIS